MKHKHKFFAKRDTRAGQKFDSQKESRYYDFLVMEQREGRVVFFLRQVPFHLPGNTTYRCDFQVFWADGTVSFVDVKGYVTKEFIRAKKQVEALYPVEIEVVR